MDDIGMVMAVSALAAVLASAVVVLVYRAARRRDRRQIEALLERLNELEGLLGTAGSPDEQSGEAEAAETAPGPRPAAPRDAPSADVLAGRTTYVRRAVEGRGADVETVTGQAIAAVHRRLADTLTPAELADELNISLRTLERGLAAELACTPTQLIVAMKMREARRLLLSGSFRVNEVAARLGFSNPYHFSRRFKEFYRVAPSELMRGRDAA